MSKKIISLVMAVSLLIAISVVFYAGMFITSFEYNLYYSDVINSISTEMNILANEKNKEKINNFNLFLSNLPIHGYETNCEELQEEIKNYKTIVKMITAHNNTLKRDFENTHFFCKERKKTACSRNPLAWRYD